MKADTAPIDHVSAPPASWTAAHVKQRLVEACEIERRLPEPPRPGGGRSTWPTTYREFSDLVGWSDEARQAVWADWQRARGVFPYEASRMEEALSWLSWLARFPQERRYLEAWARAGVNRVKLARVMRRNGISKSTFYRKVEDGAARIADQLNRRGVVVR